MTTGNTIKREYVGVNDASIILGKSNQSIRRLIRLGLLPARKVGRNYMIRIDDLHAALCGPYEMGKTIDGILSSSIVRPVGTGTI